MKHAKEKPPGKRRRAENTQPGINISRSVTIRRPASEVYAFWRDFENSKAVMPGNVSAEATSNRTSHWTARAPGGRQIEWDAEIVRDEPSRLIEWRSCEGADVANSGTVRFEPGPEHDRSTRVKLDLEYTPPGGRIGALIGKATRARAAREVTAGLRRIKHELETGNREP